MMPSSHFLSVDMQLSKAQPMMHQVSQQTGHRRTFRYQYPFNLIATIIPYEIWICILRFNTFAECQALMTVIEDCYSANVARWTIFRNKLVGACRDRWNAALYLDQTFRLPGHVGGGAHLLRAMQDVGMFLGGSRAVDFFLGGSASSESDWDFYVAPTGSNIFGAIRALESVGVKFESVTQRIVRQMNGLAPEIIISPRDQAAIHFERVLTLTEQHEQGVEQLKSSLLSLVDLRLLPAEMVHSTFVRLELIGGHYRRCPVLSGRQCELGHVGGSVDTVLRGISTPEHEYGPGLAVTQGTMVNPRTGDQSVVQLIFDSSANAYMDGSIDRAKGTSALLRTILGFHSSIVQCFISGYFAAHLFPLDLDQRHATAWNLSHQSAWIQMTSAHAIQKYERRGFRFSLASVEAPEIFHAVRTQASTLILRHSDPSSDVSLAEQDNWPLSESDELEALMSLSWSIREGRVIRPYDPAQQAWRNALRQTCQQWQATT